MTYMMNREDHYRKKKRRIEVIKNLNRIDVFPKLIFQNALSIPRTKQKSPRSFLTYEYKR